MWFLQIIQKLKENQIQFAVAGGFAVALHGAVRGTVDLDIVVVISHDNFKKIEKALHELNLKSRIPVSADDMHKFREEYIQKRNLIAWSFVNYKNPAQVVDIIITHDLKKMKSINISIHGTKVPVLSKAALIQMKKAAGRPQDLEDVKALEGLDEKN
jgi:hypothetical protein